MVRKYLNRIGFLALFAAASCTLMSPPVYEPRLASINIIDRNGLSETLSSKDRLAQYERTNFFAPQPYQKVMRVYSRRPNGDIWACITSYHPNGQVKQYLEILNNRAHGKYHEWYENGQMKIDAALVGGVGDIGTAAEKSWLFDGVCVAYDQDGKLEAEIIYSKGSLENCSTYYHANRKIWKRVPFEKGLIHGCEEIYLENGELLETNNHASGLKHGTCTRYWDGMKVAALEEYCGGRLIEGKYWNKEGYLVSAIQNGAGKKAVFSKDGVVELREYNNGEVEGRIEILNPDGSLFNVFRVKNGMKHGEEIEYYPLKMGKGKLIPKISLNWYEGAIQGAVKTWYSNGKQESQKELSKNLKNGLLTAWYEDGSLMLIEEYDHDTLVSGKYLKKGQTIPVSKVQDGNGIATIYDSQGNFVHKVNYYGGRPVL